MTLPIDQAIDFLRDTPLNEGVDTTPEEYEEYWQGIDDIEQSLQEAVYTLFDKDELYSSIDAWLESGKSAIDRLHYEVFLPRTEKLVNELVGTVQNPGIIPTIVLAGAARGNELLLKAMREIIAGGKAAKPTNLSITWDITHHAAYEFAKSYTFSLVKGINNTTATAFSDSMQSWVKAGGKLPDLIDAIEGDLPSLDIPAGWSPKKVQWATSRDRARLIAQTESTRAFAEGSLLRWEQLGYSQARWRTQNDRRVCPKCRKLHNVEGNNRDGWILEGKAYFFPVHPGCRCFPSPIVKGIEATPFAPTGRLVYPGTVQQPKEALQPTIEDMQKLYVGWGDRADSIAKARMTDGSLFQSNSQAQQDAFAPDLKSGYMPSTNKLVESGNYLAYRASVLNPDALEVASFNIVMNSADQTIKLVTANEGSFATAEPVKQWIEQLEDYAIAAGSKYFKFEASGKQLTSSLEMGFKLDSSTQTTILSRYNQIGGLAALSQYESEEKITAEHAQKYNQEIITTTSLDKLYEIGKDNVWYESGEKMWIGKALLERHMGMWSLQKNIEKPPNA